MRVDEVVCTIRTARIGIVYFTFCTGEYRAVYDGHQIRWIKAANLMRIGWL